MEIYTLNSDYYREAVIDQYKSAIWTERYFLPGDFKFELPATANNRALFAIGTLVTIDDTDRMMRVESIEDSVDADNRRIMTVSGPELLDLVNDRISHTGQTSLETPTNWTFNGTAQSLLTTLLNIGIGTSAGAGMIEHLAFGTLYPAGNVPFPSGDLDIEEPIGPLGPVLMKFAEIFDIGIRLYRGPDDGKAYLNVYTGNDRTLTQSLFPSVIFSPALNNLQNVSEFSSISDTKNVARVFGKHDNVIVYAAGASDLTVGANRREVFVDATTLDYPERPYEVEADRQAAINAALKIDTFLTETKDALQKLLDKKGLSSQDNTSLTTVTISPSLTSTQRTLISNAITTSNNYDATEQALYVTALENLGKAELPKYRGISVFDGEVVPTSMYKYRRDYGLGDLVELRNELGTTNQMRVTEHIRSSDVSGDRAYPTLSIRQTIMPGSWLLALETWADAAGYWADR